MDLNSRKNLKAPSGKVLLAVLLVVSLALVVVYAREGAGGPLHALQAGASSVASPFKAAGTGIGNAGAAVSDQIADATADESTLSGLRERNQELTALVAQTEEYRLEIERLEALLDIKGSSNVETIGANVIGRSTEAWSQTVTIDVGEADGIDTGLTVMGPYGVVGQVVNTTSGSATVRLLTDPQSGAAALVQSTRTEGVVRGSLEGLLYLENFDVDEVVNVGDVVLTSGMGGSYTSGLLIGTVVKIEGSQGDVSRRIVVSPNNPTDALSQVLVVKSAAGEGGDDA